VTPAADSLPVCSNDLLALQHQLQEKAVTTTLQRVSLRHSQAFCKSSDVVLQADVDLVSIMARTGFLPSESQRQPGSASIVTQGGSQVGQVTAAARHSASDPALQNGDTPKGSWQAAPTATAGTK